ncbi:MAG: NlpC/P60 family protein [Ilumatobacteraceae bacterium]|nr:C40 family peptidase [Acidimicrobiales bacterium]MCB9393206.1 C40 family peptidase [Acidimicrobiaceae bacterium]
MSIRTHRRTGSTRRFRRVVVAAALASATVTTVALPTGAVQAAPAAVTVDRGRARQADVIADQAAAALNVVERFLETGDADLLDSFDEQRDAIAAAVAERLGLDPAAMQRAWRTADLDHQTALIAGLGQLGVSYRRNTSKPGVSFDCSGFTTYAWSRAGVTLARQSSAQIKAAAPRDPSTAQAGDLVQYPGHVMMWLGVDRAVVHAIQPGKPVSVDIVSGRKSLRFGDPTV